MFGYIGHVFTCVVILLGVGVIKGRMQGGRYFLRFEIRETIFFFILLKYFIRVSRFYIVAVVIIFDAVTVVLGVQPRKNYYFGSYRCYSNSDNHRFVIRRWDNNILRSLSYSNL